MAKHHGLNPAIPVEIAWLETINWTDWHGDRGIGGSWGPFQLYMGGGMGNTFETNTGSKPSDLSTWKKQVDFALETMAQSGSTRPWSVTHNRPNLQNPFVSTGKVGGLSAPLQQGGATVSGDDKAVKAAEEEYDRLVKERTTLLSPEGRAAFIWKIQGQKTPILDAKGKPVPGMVILGKVKNPDEKDIDKRVLEDDRPDYDARASYAEDLMATQLEDLNKQISTARTTWTGLETAARTNAPPATYGSASAKKPEDRTSADLAILTAGDKYLDESKDPQVAEARAAIVAGTATKKQIELVNAAINLQKSELNLQETRAQAEANLARGGTLEEARFIWDKAKDARDQKRQQFVDITATLDKGNTAAEKARQNVVDRTVSPVVAQTARDSMNALRPFVPGMPEAGPMQFQQLDPNAEAQRAGSPYIDTASRMPGAFSADSPFPVSEEDLKLSPEAWRAKVMADWQQKQTGVAAPAGGQ